jgi:hypothetical protein
LLGVLKYVMFMAKKDNIVFMRLVLPQPEYYKIALLNLLKLLQLKGLPKENIEDVKRVYELLEILDANIKEQNIS